MTVVVALQSEFSYISKPHKDVSDSRAVVQCVECQYTCTAFLSEFFYKGDKSLKVLHKEGKWLKVLCKYDLQGGIGQREQMPLQKTKETLIEYLYFSTYNVHVTV